MVAIIMSAELIFLPPLKSKNAGKVSYNTILSYLSNTVLPVGRFRQGFVIVLLSETIALETIALETVELETIAPETIAPETIALETAPLEPIVLEMIGNIGNIGESDYVHEWKKQIQ